jgi:regulatory protein
VFNHNPSSEQIKVTCLRLLNRREHSQQELLSKLALKGFNQSDIQYALDELAQQGWQSDERFAQSYARSRLNSGFGSLKIQFELKQRGISHFDLDCLVEEEFGSWQDLLLQVYQQKYATNVNLTAKDRLKHSYFLQQRGFTHTMINKLFQQLKLNAAQSNDD